ncbi:Halomucin [Frankliniella fusca]|uniref:Halomucin n=1 Tax=Frankliniella fusca TaxID=407009 RepID=A0AAE1HBQ7_9NEOP|nr:Halomucin [Frankliniella fusca]
MSFESEESLCDVSYSFYYYPHEDDESSEYFTQPSSLALETHKIPSENSACLELSTEELQKCVTEPFQCNEPSSSNQIPDQSHVTVVLGNGIKLKLSKDVYQKYVAAPLISFGAVTDEDKKSVTIDTDSDGSSEDESKKNKKADSEDDKKSKSDKSDTEKKKNTDHDKKGQEKKSQNKKKRKPQKDSDVSTSSSSESVKKSQPKKKRKKVTKPEKEPDTTDEDDSDEEIRKINAAAAKIPTYKSIKNLTKNQYYKVLDLQDIETSKGRTVRLKLEDKDVEDGWCFQSSCHEHRQKAKVRQRNHRKSLSSSAQARNRLKSKNKMQKIRARRTVKEKNIQKELNSERRYLHRLAKRSGVTYNSEILDLDQYNFACYMKSLQWVVCRHCHKKTIHSSFRKFHCTKNCKLFTKDNDLDPMSVPEELSTLTFIEKQLISRVHPVISLYRVKKMQYKYKGQVINFSQNVQYVADTLPHLVTDLNNIVIVKLEDQVALKDFVVRRDKLQHNNPHYEHINIDFEKVKSLPVNDNVLSV